MRSMFLPLGGALSFIVGLVCVLNFFNAILTGIIARQRELAVLQSFVGMTGRQLRAADLGRIAVRSGGGRAGSDFDADVNRLPSRRWKDYSGFYLPSEPLTLLFIIPLFALLGAGIPVITGSGDGKTHRSGTVADGVNPINIMHAGRRQNKSPIPQWL